MLFNSIPFIFLFLPLAVAAFYTCRKFSFNAAIIILALFSFFFYAYWSPVYIFLFLGSIIVNYTLAGYLYGEKPENHRKMILYAAIFFNLALLFYFKYAVFTVTNIALLTGKDIIVPDIILPIGISFFTFQQIAYQVDIYRRLASDHHFWRYCLFISLFPHLLAGPIVHHQEMMPQFEKRARKPLQKANIIVGMTIFIIGLFKKVIIADTLARYANPIFDDALHGTAVDFYAAWIGALAYTFQIYFDFSGYSDMAVGSARLFGIRLPVNFFSPYKATSIIDFWRRWHMTLSRFFRDYLYIPLGGNRKGPHRQLLNVLIVMFLVGFWHGAGWTFVVWGIYHGALLVFNHIWRDKIGLRLPALAGILLTFLAVVAGWMFFRAETIDAALTMIGGLTGFHGISLPVHFFIHGMVPDGMGIAVSTAGAKPAIAILAAALIAFLMPNSITMMKGYKPVLMSETAPSSDWSIISLQWRPNIAWAFVMASLFLWSACTILSGETEFLYFNF